MRLFFRTIPKPLKQHPILKKDHPFRSIQPFGKTPRSLIYFHEGTSRLNRVIAGFPGPDTDDLLGRGYENLSVADLSGLCRIEYAFQR
jgi:hypothetical protein